MDPEVERSSSRRNTIRRKSTMTRQHSYDDEIKTAAIAASLAAAHSDTGLGLPAHGLPRRASAYDVYSSAGSSGNNSLPIVQQQHRASMSAQGMFSNFIIF